MEDIEDKIIGQENAEPTESPFNKLPGGEGGWVHQIILFAAK